MEPGEGWIAVGRESRREFSHGSLPHALLREVPWTDPDGVERTVWRLWLAPGVHGDEGLRRAQTLPLPAPLWLDLSQSPRLSGAALAGLSDRWRQDAWVLDWTHGTADDDVLSALGAWEGLRELRLSGCPATGSALASLASLPSLGRLSLAGCPHIDGTGLSALAGLRELHLGRTRLSAPGLREVCALRGLRRLSMPHAQLPEAPLRDIARIEVLEALDLSMTAVDDLEPLASLPAMQRLRCGGLAPRGWSALGALDALVLLDLSGSSVADGDLRPWPALAELDLAGTAAGDPGVAELLGCRRLAELDLSRCPVTDASIARLGTRAALRSLSLLACPGVSAAAVEALRAKGKRVEWFAG